MPSPSEIVRTARPGHTVVGWKLDNEQRTVLLKQFPPAYRQVVADHVTLKPRVAENTALPDNVTAELVGRADDGRGVEAMVVSIDGDTARPGGSTYHITWSLANGRRPKESNDVIANAGWEAVERTPVMLKPARFR